jgi:branched-chain amino acid transport system substrate-binding protein
VAGDFVRAYDEAGLFGKVPLLGTGMLTDETFLGGRHPATLDIRSAFAWSSDMNSPENMAFISTFRRHTGRAPDLFALLGYETLLLILNALPSRGGKPQSAEAFARTLRRVKFQGPRGLLCMDPVSRNTRGPVYAFRVRSDGTAMRSEVVARLGPLAGLEKRFEKLTSGTRSGWINMYLTG